ncbi:helix-turn-helix domain-containing protein, partial [Coprobacillus cateniformis]
MKKHNLKINDVCECTGLSYSKIYGYLNGTVPKDDDL